mmetsp:Transcript_40339/g.38818  ORF Transcript_40339/g.38818 Transcript_40339/m.38818 type:complete len:131 (+) Transcript_40339:926-1318(+)
MLTGETMHERLNTYKLHYKMDRQMSMMDRMQGKIPKLINPFNKGVFMNILEFYLPMFPCIVKKGIIHAPVGDDLMRARNSSSKKGKSKSYESRDHEEIEMTNTTIDMDEEAKLDSERESMIGSGDALTPQ